jgi:hypothetical protein
MDLNPPPPMATKPSLAVLAVQSLHGYATVKPVASSSKTKTLLLLVTVLLEKPSASAPK